MSLDDIAIHNFEDSKVPTTKRSIVLDDIHMFSSSKANESAPRRRFNMDALSAHGFVNVKASLEASAAPARTQPQPS
jgi:hypothetical protein